MQILLESKLIAGIPVLTMAQLAATRCPLIFFIPGYGGTKEVGLSLGYRLAAQGFFVVSFDPWLHGERYAPRLDQAAAPQWGGLYPPATGLDTGIAFFQVIEHCLRDVQTLLAYYQADARVDSTRCGVTGLSMGGCASFLIFANVPQIKAAVPMIGIPTFTRRWTDLIDECTFSDPSWAAALQQVAAHTAQQTAWIRQLDPAESLKNAAPRALLIMNCDFDADQPKHYAIDCYRTLLPFYTAQPDQLQLRIYPAGHVVTAAMEEEAVAWFTQQLSCSM